MARRAIGLTVPTSLCSSCIKQSTAGMSLRDGRPRFAEVSGSGTVS